MNLTRSAVNHPALVGIGLALVFLLGLISIRLLPVQLFPDIDRPGLSVEVFWRAAAPEEMESEITEPLEDVLKGLPGLKHMNSSSGNGRTEVEMEFALNTDMEKTMLEVINRMNQVSGLPDNINGPFIESGGSNDSLTFLFLQQLPGNERPIKNYQSLIDTRVKPVLESVKGVSGVDVRGEGQRQLEIIFDPARAAELEITIPELARRVSTGFDISGGSINIGRKEYKLRLAGKYEISELGELVVAWRDGKPVYLKDIASIEITRGKERTLRIQNGNPAIGMEVRRESGANALEALLNVKEQVAILNDTVLVPEGVKLVQSFDASIFIKRAINMVSSSLIFGILLAIGVLWFFLRRWRATLLIAMAIPVCLMLTICMVKLTGRTLNLVSLAGLAFSVGMVLDAAIVVLESMVRQRERDVSKTKAESAVIASNKVWSALLASTLTTVAIFLPIMLLNDIEGQLFSDLALTIAASVAMSLMVAMTVLPTAAAKWLPDQQFVDHYQNTWNKLTNLIMGVTRTTRRRWLVILLFMGIPIILTRSAIPQMDYLPQVKRDAVDVWVRFTPGTSVESVKTEIMPVLVDRLAPYMSGEQEPALRNYYFILWPGGASMGIRAADQSRIKELESLVMDEIVQGIPDMQAFGGQGNLFGGFGNDNGVDLDLQAGDLRELYAAAGQAMAYIQEQIPGARVRPRPGLDFTAPELQLIPNDTRLAEAGWYRTDLPQVVRVLGEGTQLGEYFDGDERMRIILKGEELGSPEQLEATPLMTPAGGVIPLGELVSVEPKLGPGSIRRVDQRRTLTLSISLPDDMTLQSALEKVEQDIIPGVRGFLPDDGQIRVSGNADSLKQAITNLVSIFAFALFILLILLWGLFKSFKDAALVILTLPLATVGGLMAIHLLNMVSEQSVDLLTMIGFVILLGLVVNNAILLVHQARVGEREGLQRSAAVREALLTRMRPIFMTTLTSIFGMLPLLLSPTTGSEIYRGLAAVIVGGMTVSSLFTLVLLPALLQLGKAKSVEARVYEHYAVAAENASEASSMKAAVKE
ncbi:efflux RND transporter permease subunit [Parendozoicomonas haliclonae]|uniref:Multidrug resistance protein MexB n=1 Tax=Parendozoicomonas haliclonae TaxID=1960125 RepID=A0A1X7AIR1_9GAMM|nr:efflux RND transporter permease subunit [Parendozoicomonas haliclonae]SMA44100.1 Multidrug resistance protein MexB [Parendozoicomonas haliclonae]